MARVREYAKCIKITNQNNEGEMNPPPPLPPPQQETRAETLPSSSRRAQHEGEKSPPPLQEDTGREEASNSVREMVGAERSNAASSKEETSGNKIRVTIDPDRLDCTICTDPLCPPVHECFSGHLLCISCWKKVEDICPACRQPRGKRNIAFEAVLESAHLPCTYANLGCREFVSYSKSLVHADTCEFGPSLCPIPGCGHKDFSGKWRAHFLKEHWNPGPHNSEIGSHYNYGECCAIRFDEKDLYYTLLGPGEDLFLLVKEHILNVGYVPLLYYIDLPDRGQNVFPYELGVDICENGLSSSMQRKSKAASIKEWKRGEARDFSLFLPVGYDSRSMKVHVLIKKELDEEPNTILSVRPEEEDEEGEHEEEKGEEEKEEEEKEEEDTEPPAKRKKNSAAEASIKTKGKVEEKEKDGDKNVNAKKEKESKEVKVQEEKEGKKKDKKEEAAAKPKYEEKKEAKTSTSNAAKEKKKPAAKKQGKQNMSEDVKSPSKEELHAVISELLMEVDLNKVTMADILQKLGAQFKADLMDRKAEVKQIIEDVMNSMSEEEDEDVQ